MTTSFIPAQPGRTRLVQRSDDAASYTGNRETDVRTALTRGLAEYMAQLRVDAPGGRRVALASSKDTWTDSEVPAKYPGACVYTTQPGTYDASKIGGAGASIRPGLQLPDGRYLVSAAEFTIDVNVDCYCTDNAERLLVASMLEDAMVPANFAYGLRLELPHYFNERATYEMLSSSYADSELEATRRWRRVQFLVRARCPLTRLVELPTARPRFEAKQISPDAPVG